MRSSCASSGLPILENCAPKQRYSGGLADVERSLISSRTGERGAAGEATGEAFLFPPFSSGDDGSNGGDHRHK